MSSFSDDSLSIAFSQQVYDSLDLSGGVEVTALEMRLTWSAWSTAALQAELGVGAAVFAVWDVLKELGYYYPETQSYLTACRIVAHTSQMLAEGETSKKPRLADLLFPLDDNWQTRCHRFHKALVNHLACFEFECRYPHFDVKNIGIMLSGRVMFLRPHANMFPLLSQKVLLAVRTRDLPREDGTEEQGSVLAAAIDRLLKGRSEQQESWDMVISVGDDVPLYQFPAEVRLATFLGIGLRDEYDIDIGLRGDYDID